MASDSPRLDSNAGGGKYDSVNRRRLCCSLQEDSREVRRIRSPYLHTRRDMSCTGLVRSTCYNAHCIRQNGLLILVLREIAANTALGLSKEVFPVDPIMVVVCSTKALEDYILSVVRIEGEISLTRLSLMPFALEVCGDLQAKYC